MSMTSTMAATGNAQNRVERATWSNHLEFIFSCLGYAIGLGNVWRFPYLAYINGGGAFLLPYTIMLILVGIPIFLIEVAMGQYSACGPMTVWEVSPLFQGVGAGMVTIAAITSIYYNQIIAWSLYYMVASFQKVLPWDGCGHSFNTPNCYSKKEARPCEADNGIWYNMTCFNRTWLLSYDVITTKCSNVITKSGLGKHCFNITSNIKYETFANHSGDIISSSEEFFNIEMLQRSDSIEATGSLQWELVMYLFLAWIICFLCVCKGIKLAGKVVYFTATVPFALLVVLFFKGISLPGSWNGIKFFIIPKWEQLIVPKVWVDAAGQIFFSLSVGMGGLMTFASYNKFHYNVYRDTFIIAIGNSTTSIFAGFAIFSILGYMAYELKQPVEMVVKSGSGLAFIAYPEMVTHLPIAQFWSVLFFLMLVTLGMDSQFANIEACQTAVMDMFPRFRHKECLVASIICSSLFFLGLTMCTNAGIYWTELMSYYSSGWSLVLIGLAEAIVFPWVYGAENIIDNIEQMVGFKLGMHWWFCWKFVTPLILLVVLVLNIINFVPLSFGSYVLPTWAQALGWGMALVSVACIPIGSTICIYFSYQDPKYDGLSFYNRVKTLSHPTDEWKPSIDKYIDIKTTNEPGAHAVRVVSGAAVAPQPGEPAELCVVEA